jgi:hypothetical protein
LNQIYQIFLIYFYLIFWDWPSTKQNGWSIYLPRGMLFSSPSKIETKNIHLSMKQWINVRRNTCIYLHTPRNAHFFIASALEQNTCTDKTALEQSHASTTSTCLDFNYFAHNNNLTKLWLPHVTCSIDSTSHTVVLWTSLLCCLLSSPLLGL